MKFMSNQTKLRPHLFFGVSVTAANLACGVYYINNQDWINVDWEANSPAVRQMNLSSTLEFDDAIFDFVYTSHFIEHLSLEASKKFLNECRRILKPGGVIRIVTPDFHKICEEYIRQYTLGNQLFAEFIKFSLTDQMTRIKPGGQFHYWRKLAETNNNLRDYIQTWTGISTTQIRSPQMKQDMLTKALRAFRKVVRNPKSVIRVLIWKYCHLAIYIFPSWFRQNHIALCRPGERHLYIHDFNSLADTLQGMGFKSVTKVTPDTSISNQRDFRTLDIDDEGKPRKGVESMYIEAVRDS